MKSTLPATQKTRALDLLNAKGMLRLKDFIAENIEAETLARLVRGGQVIRPARGLYRLPDAQVDAPHSLAEAALRSSLGCTPAQVSSRFSSDAHYQRLLTAAAWRRFETCS